MAQQRGIIDFGPAQQILGRGDLAQFFAEDGFGPGLIHFFRHKLVAIKVGVFFFHRFLLGIEHRPAQVIDQAKFTGNRCQADIGIVLTQHQPVFGAAGEHAVRLAGAGSDQIIDQYADIGFVTAWVPGVQSTRLQTGIQTGNQALGAGFFITGGAVDLTGEEQAPHMCLVSSHGFRSRGIEKVIFNGITRTGDMGIFQAFH